MTHIHDLVEQLAKIERELEEQKAEIALKVRSNKVDPSQNSTTSGAAPEAARPPENERQGFTELRSAIFDGLKLLKPQSILTIVHNLRKRKRPTLPGIARAPRHFPTRFANSNSSSSSVRLLKNVSIPRIKLRTRSDDGAGAEPIPSDILGVDASLRNASKPRKTVPVVSPRDAILPGFDISVTPKVETADAELEENSTFQIPAPAAAAVGGLAYICGVCGAIFKDQDSLKLHDDEGHQAVVVYEKKHKCTLCPAKFANPWYLKRHLLVHNAAKRFQCPSCSRLFTYAHNLKAHLKTPAGASCAKLAGLPPPRPKVKCKLCPAAFARQEQLKLHLLAIHSHSGENPFQCSSCLKSFSYKRSLQAHFKTLAGAQCAAQKTPNPNPNPPFSREKNYECELCQAKFREGWEVKRHLRVHTGEKPFQCPSCPKAFAYKQSLEVHLKTEAGASCAAAAAHAKLAQKQKIRLGNPGSDVDVGRTTTESESCGDGDCDGVDDGADFVQEDVKFVPDPDPNLYDDDDLQDQDQDQILPDGIIEEEEEGFSRFSQVLAHVPQVLTRFLCRLCGAIFEDSGSLERHEKSHS